MNLFDEEECKKIESLHKELLETAMNINERNEVGFLVNLIDWSYLTTLGAERGVTIRSNPSARGM